MNEHKEHEDVDADVDVDVNEDADEVGELSEPVLAGAEETTNDNVDPRKGESDPALIRHPEEHDKTVAPYNL